MVLEKTLDSSLDCKEIKPVSPKWNQSWIFIGRANVEAETPILWQPNVKNWLIWKDPDAGKDWRQEEKGTTEAEIVGWHHQLNGHEFEWTSGVGDGQGGLVCCNSLGPMQWGNCWAAWGWRKKGPWELEQVPMFTQGRGYWAHLSSHSNSQTARPRNAGAQVFGKSCSGVIIILRSNYYHASGVLLLRE